MAVVTAVSANNDADIAVVPFSGKTKRYMAAPSALSLFKFLFIKADLTWDES